ncbi:hypothetical protein [Caballeronia temeraria]|uniref:hypothetical protein n=1 Tax=Caballeronia temeraria TaxID=1777137 RepID=UPI0012FD1EAD|nr:hypothetical protein [Caballeronia temeraria]
MMNLITESQEEAFASILFQEADAAVWLNASSTYGSPYDYLSAKLEEDGRFVFQLAFEELELSKREQQ